MSRQISPYEKVLFDIIKEYDNRFYYDEILRVVEGDQFQVRVEKGREEMVGRAYVTLQNGDNIEYEIKYNRIFNLNEGYTLLVSGAKTG